MRKYNSKMSLFYKFDIQLGVEFLWEKETIPTEKEKLEYAKVLLTTVELLQPYQMKILVEAYKKELKTETNPDTKKATRDQIKQMTKTIKLMEKNGTYTYPSFPKGNAHNPRIISKIEMTN